MLSLSLPLCLALSMPQGPAAPVVINEFVYDAPGGGEFVELYNATGSDIDISGWVLDSEDPFGPNTSYTVPGGTVLLAGNYWVIGTSGVPNVNQPLGGSDPWENSQESLTLRDASGAIVDTLVYEVNKGLWTGAQALLEGEGIWGNLQVFSGMPTSWSRIRDGFDLGNNGTDFVVLPWTPGAPNDLSGSLPFIEFFDGLTPDTPVPGFAGTFVTAHTVDPTVAGPYNPAPIPASPQGGNAMVAWDPVGGGNTVMFLSEITGDAVFEALVYFDATLAPTSQYQTWTVGFGTSASFFNTPDPGGVFGFTANGNTGVGWTYQVTEASATLYLVDHGDGGWGAAPATPPVVLGTVPIQAGVNDGWQRIRLERNGNKVLGNFGTTQVGCADGTSLAGDLFANVPTTLYIGYREGFSGGIGPARPFTADAVFVRGTSRSLTPFGSASPTASGNPSIDANAPASIGFQGWELQMANLVPNSTAVLALGVQKQQPPIPLGPLGAPATAQLLVDPVLTLSLPIDGSGNAKLAAPLACNPTWVGTSLFWQAFTVDPALGVPLPLAHTSGLETLLGN